MTRVCIPCAERAVQRLAEVRETAIAAGDLAAADVAERQLAGLVRLAWPCVEDGCDEPVTLGTMFSRRRAQP